METGDGCSCLTNRSHFNYSRDINVERKWHTKASCTDLHTPIRALNLQPKTTKELKAPWSHASFQMYASLTAFTCVYSAKFSVLEILHANTHTPTASQWAVKLKMSLSFCKPHCFAYKTCIMVVTAIIMALKSKVHFRGGGVMERSAAGKRTEQQEHWGR